MSYRADMYAVAALIFKYHIEALKGQTVEIEGRNQKCQCFFSLSRGPAVTLLLLNENGILSAEE